MACITVPIGPEPNEVLNKYVFVLKLGGLVINVP